MYPGTYAKLTPDKPAIIMVETGETITYAQLDDESTRLARVFRAAGLERGDTVAVLMGNDPRYLTVCWAAQRIGLYSVPVNWHLTVPEMQYIIDNCGAKVLVVNGTVAEAAAELLTLCPTVSVPLALAVDIPGFDSLSDAIAAQPGGPLENETEGADMIYSSGTTGRPKGGARPLGTRHPSAPNPAALAFFNFFALDDQTVYLMPGAPLYHAAPLRFTMAVTRFGGTNVIMERFDPEEALAAIERHQVTHSQWVPTMFVRLLRLDDGVRSKFDLSSHHVAIHAAAPCPVAIKEEMIGWWGPIIEEYYGGSEGGGLSYLKSDEWLAHRGSVGKAVVGTFHIVGEDGNVLPPGQPGAIYASGGLPVEYLNDPEKTKAAYNSDGWVTIGDIGYLDHDGYLYLTDRKDHMIISGGVNIYPQETEDVLIRHPKVADVAVIGVPNEELGEEVKAVVQLLDPADASDELARELIAFCLDNIARYKCPRSVDFEAELPRAPSGKLYKRRLRDRYWAGNESRLPS